MNHRETVLAVEATPLLPGDDPDGADIEAVALDLLGRGGAAGRAAGGGAEAAEVQPPAPAPATARDQGARAGLLIQAGELDDAEELLLAARRALGGDALEVAIVDGHLAVVALRQGRLVEAEALGRRALAVKKAVLGPSSPGLAPTLTTLGTICQQAGRTWEAAALHEQASAVLRGAVEPDHPLPATIERSLAGALAPATSG